MAYILNGSTIKRPNSMTENNSTQVAQNRVLSGNIARDFFGSNKRVWKLSYENINTTDFALLNTIYQAYLLAGNAVTWQVTEGAYPVSSTSVHVDLQTRDFSVPGSSYLSTTELILTEA